MDASAPLSSTTAWRPSRRELLCQAGGGFGALALAALLAESSALLAESSEAATSGRPRFRPRARSVIHIFLHGGPSHVDLVDPKPALLRHAGQPLPASVGEVMTRRKVARNPLLPAIRPFRPGGRSGLELSDFIPELRELADRLSILRGVHGDSVNHPQSVYQMNTGSVLMGRPSLASWVSYGLGTENRDLPSYVVLPDPGGAPKGGPPAWGSGFLPGEHQGTLFRAGAAPLVHLARPPGISREAQRRALDFRARLDRQHAAAREFSPDLLARLESYELAFRLQAAAPEAVDLSTESAATRRLYGLDDPSTRDFAERCLLARRLVERGVRFVQLYSGDTGGWDAHNDVAKNHGQMCRRTDRPVAGLLRDLESRGLLDDTLVVWGGEFGRMPMSEKGSGRDHNPWGYSVVLAGGGVKGGFTHGQTDDFGLRAAEDRVHVRDLHATILALLGLDPELLSFRRHGIEERLSEIPARVVEEIFA